MTVKTTSTPIAMVDLKRQIEAHYEEFIQDFKTTLERVEFVGGQAVDAFEAAFAEYCQAKHCIGVGNGTDALYLTFRALGLQPGDEVIVPAMSFMATAEILAPLGLKAVFADIDAETYTLSPALVKPLITEKTKAILPVHLYGQPADMSGLQALAEAHNLYLIEDSAQGHAAEYQGKRTGSLGFAAAFSFYPGKNLGAFGDGGAIVTNDDEFAKTVRMLANHGRLSKYEHLVEGVNSRLDTFQAAILLTKLKYLDEWTRQRQQRAILYSELLIGIPELTLPKTAMDRTHVYHLYVIQTARRDELLDYLQTQGIQVGIHYPIPLHLQPAMHYLGYREGDFPVSEKLGRECLSLPMFPELTSEQTDTVCAAVRRLARA